MSSFEQMLRALVVALCLLSTVQAFSSPITRASTSTMTTTTTTYTVKPLFMSEEDSEAGAAAASTSMETTQETAAPKPPVKCPNCDKCDGSGRILGGIAVLLPWWPIKAYRPCPNFIANGGFYERSGQGLDEIAFGRDSTYEKY